MKNWMWIVLILAIGAGAYYWWSKKKQMVDGPTNVDASTSNVIDALIEDVQQIQQAIVNNTPIAQTAPAQANGGK